jgi:hypothetical protein
VDGPRSKSEKEEEEWTWKSYFQAKQERRNAILRKRLPNITVQCMNDHLVWKRCCGQLQTSKTCHVDLVTGLRSKSEKEEEEWTVVGPNSKQKKRLKREERRKANLQKSITVHNMFGSNVE